MARRTDRSIRPLQQADIAAVVNLSLDAWEPVFASFAQAWGQPLYERFFPNWRSQQAAAVRGALSANSTWVSVDEATVTGFVNVIFDVGEKSGEIFMIAVAPAFQRRGLARRLTDHALDEMRSRGLTLATVSTGADPGHAPARQTYESAGFTPLPQVLYARLL